MTRFTKVSTVLALALVASAATAQAQTPLAVTANVYQALALSAARPLAFGNVFPGVDKTIALADGGNGAYLLAGQGSVPVSFTFVLPANLSDGANNLAIDTYTASHAATDIVGTAFDPATNPTLTLAAGGTMYIRLGATVRPTAGQVAGAYTGTIQLTVAY